MRHLAIIPIMLAGLTLPAGAPSAQPVSTAPPRSEWTAFTRRYLAGDGRVIDTANGGISHSEGQGYGLFFAEYFNDQASFARIWQWTRVHLDRPTDALHAWRFDPHSTVPVSDFNNATDGDIYIAWALLRAAERWQMPEYHTWAVAIARDLLRCCTLAFEGRMLLMPGATGFVAQDGVKVNLSYYAFPALRALSRAAPDPRWVRLEEDGMALLQEASYGQWRLPPDWLLVQPRRSGPPTIAPDQPPRFSWDALRIPLNLAWAHSDAPTLTAAMRFWEDHSHAHSPPAWVDLRTGLTPPYAGHAGIRAVHALARARLSLPAAKPRVAEATDYYGAALLLQASIAADMAVEAPALVPLPGAAEARTGFWEQVWDQGENILDEMRNEGENLLRWTLPHAQAAPVPAVDGAWSRARMAPPQEVRGIQPGLRDRRPQP
ncbi:MAG: glycosyl hydrolase family 8 [Roseococcus sp.]